jgi:hypothetical protein
MVDWNRRLQRRSTEWRHSNEWKGEQVPEQPKPFHVLFREHLAAGTQAAGARLPKWKHSNFADEIGCADRTVTNWKNGSRTPPQPELDRIVALLFGDNPVHAEAKAIMTDAWKKAGSERRKPGRRRDERSESGSRGPVGLQWPLTPEEPARLYVNQNQGQPLSDVVPLEVTVSTTDFDVPIEQSGGIPGYYVNIGFKKVRIVSRHDRRITLVAGSVLGTESRKRPGVEWGTSWRVDVSCQADGKHGGMVLESEKLCDFRVPKGESYKIDVEVICHRDDLDPRYDRRPPRANDKQLAVLRQVVKWLSGDPRSDFVSLAQGELSGKTDP